MSQALFLEKEYMEGNIKDDIFRLRIEAGLSQKQLAVKLRVNRAAVIKWEAGTTYPRARNLRKLGNIFGVTFDKKGIIEPTINMKIDKDPQKDEKAIDDGDLWYKKTIETLIHQNGNTVDKLHERVDKLHDRDQAEIEDLKKEKQKLWDEKSKIWEHIDVLTVHLKPPKNQQQ